ncbi:MAG: Holliday junction branch migration protein RuvA [bacterium]
MISFLEGKIEEIYNTSIILNVNGVGYEVFVTQPQQFKTETTCKIYTCPIYREDSQSLYGFENPEQRNFFKLLVEKVSGVGPKLALGILSFFKMSDLCSIIFNNDANQLSKCPGIGKKTAQRLILELHDYLKKLPVDTPSSTVSKSHADAVEALVVLGYARKQAEQLIEKIQAEITSEDTVETILKKVFKLHRMA